MTDLERLVLQVSARLTGDDLRLVLDYAAALERQTGVDALRDAMSKPDAIDRLFDEWDHETAFKPYWPEMLDYELPENSQAEHDEITAYYETFMI